MIQSMTGYADAALERDGRHARVEIRSVNNRHLKLTVRGTDPYPMWESDFEKLVRRHVQRGTVTLHVRLERPAAASSYQLNLTAVRAYTEQLAELGREADWPVARTAAVMGGILHLPGVTREPENVVAIDEEWPLVEEAVLQALDGLQVMRAAEGQAMAAELLRHRDYVSSRLEQVQAESGDSVEKYRDRLLERINHLLGDSAPSLRADDLAREVALFADRCDVSEEIIRLRTHLEQMGLLIESGSDAPGRKLDFLAQEMNREINTIGSKSADVRLSRLVVEMKATLEKIRELVQNVE